MTTRQAVEKLIHELKNDEGFRISWKANIAMAFCDQSNWDERGWDKTQVHETANKAADYFLNLLCHDTPSKTTEEGGL